MGAVYPQLAIPFTVNSINSKPPVRKIKRLTKTHLHTNAWRLTDFEFDSLNATFSFSLEASCDLDGLNRHDTLSFYSEKYSFLSHDIAVERSRIKARRLGVLNILISPIDLL